MDAIDKIAAWTSRPGWTQADLAEKAGVSKQYISRIVNREHEMSDVHKTIAIAKAMGCSVEYLMDSTKGWPPPERVERTIEPWQDALLRVIDMLGPDIARRRILTSHPAELGIAGAAPPTAGAATPGLIVHEVNNNDTTEPGGGQARPTRKKGRKSS